jgi:hypothetical protein
MFLPTTNNSILRAARAHDGAGGVLCRYNGAIDVHCCNCHSGFVFDGTTHTAPCLLAE